MDLKRFILENKDWESILSAPPYNLKWSRDGKYILFKYTMGLSNFSIPLVREARGCIFYEPTWECVCRGFDKFGNYGEFYCPEIDWKTAEVQIKRDGSLIKLWYHNGKWRISTNGAIDAYKVALPEGPFKSYGDLVVNIIKSKIDFDWLTAKLSPTTTYMFELCSPYNKVIIPYEESKLYFIGWRENESGQEFRPECSVVSDFFDLPGTCPLLLTLEDVQEAANALPWDEEGYVVCDTYFNRVKIKSPSYVAAHYSLANGQITNRRLLKIILQGEFDEICAYGPKFIPRIMDIRKKMADLEENAKKVKEILQNNFSFDSQKDYANLVLKINNSAIKCFCFSNKTWAEMTASWSVDKWLNALNLDGDE